MNIKYSTIQILTIIGNQLLYTIVYSRFYYSEACLVENTNFEGEIVP